VNRAIVPDHASLRGKRVLIVEDDDCLYHALRDSLQDAGCEIFGSCERVCDPLDTVPASRLDAALVDADALNARRVAYLTQHLGDRAIPIVWITARSGSELTRAGQVHEPLRKPFTERELLDGMAGAVATSAAMQRGS
jgi:AmiR/NasT family two-component response regulator